jgi:DnaK suppressor protein
MTEAQRKHLEKRLQEERQRVTHDLARYYADSSDTMQDESGDLSVVPTHMADEGTDTSDQEMAAANAMRLTAELEQIDAALERLYHDPKQFGRCEKSGREIPFARLDIIPWARTCDDETEPPRQRPRSTNAR